jgi:hypothetical protein
MLIDVPKRGDTLEQLWEYEAEYISDDDPYVVLDRQSTYVGVRG